jgi:CRISPR-associated endonuclease/helicase Cas3
MITPKMFFAHSLENRPLKEWEPLSDHLERVAELAGQFAGKFGSQAWGRQLGLWHDLGKFTIRFQNYLLQENGYEIHLEEKSQIFDKVDHSTAGAKHAINEFRKKPGNAAAGWLLAYAIAGHHSGLPDGINDQASCLKPGKALPPIF